MLLLDLRKADGPLYRRVYHALKSMIRDGRLAPAARLPSSRPISGSRAPGGSGVA
jgi:DNA-binding transcriptional MocR family regulator